MSDRMQLGFMGSLGVGLAVCIWLSLELGDARASAEDAMGNLARIKKLQNEIEELRKLDSNAHLEGEQPTESTSTWVRYATQAGIGDSQFVDIKRLPLTAIPDTAYSRDDVFLWISDLNVPQVVQFLLRCSQTDIGYTPTSVRLVAKPGSQGEVEQWDAKLVLTRLLFTAKSPQ